MSHQWLIVAYLTVLTGFPTIELAGSLHSDPGELATGQFFLPTILLGIGYYPLNATGVALVVALQARARLSRVWSKSLL